MKNATIEESLHAIESMLKRILKAQNKEASEQWELTNEALRAAVDGLLEITKFRDNDFRPTVEAESAQDTIDKIQRILKGNKPIEGEE